jgi:transposase
MTKKHTWEFQENAVRLATRPGNSVAATALLLKIPVWKLRQWIRERKDKLERSSEIDELISLRNELKQAKEEIEILKKAAAYFARTLQ